MNTYTSRKHYSTDDLIDMGVNATALLTGHKADAIHAWLALTSTRLTIIANDMGAKARTAWAWAVTILALIGIAPIAAIFGIITISRDILRQRHPSTLPDNVEPLLADNMTTPAHIPDQLPVPKRQETIDATAQEQPAVASPVPAVTTERPEAAEKPAKGRKAKKKATERTDGTSPRYRRKGNVYTLAKKRVKNEVLYHKVGDNYIPLIDTLPVDCWQSTR